MNHDILKDENFKKTYPIVLVPYNSNWKIWYSEEKNNIVKLLNGIRFNRQYGY